MVPSWHAAPQWRCNFVSVPKNMPPSPPIQNYSKRFSLTMFSPVAAISGGYGSTVTISCWTPFCFRSRIPSHFAAPLPSMIGASSDVITTTGSSFWPTQCGIITFCYWQDRHYKGPMKCSRPESFSQSFQLIWCEAQLHIPILFFLAPAHFFLCDFFFFITLFLCWTTKPPATPTSISACVCALHVRSFPITACKGIFACSPFYMLLFRLLSPFNNNQIPL